MTARQEKVIVTGGAGFIGSHLVEELLAQGFTVHCIDNFAGGRREDRLHPDAPVHEVDIREYEAIATLFEGSRYVFHAAALPRVPYSLEHPRETHDVNVTGTLNVLHAAKERGVQRVVFSSSSAVYGDQQAKALSEDLPAKPKSPYGLHKYMGECMCRAYSEIYDLATVSLRYFNVYGARFDPEGPYALVIGRFLQQRAEGSPLTICGDGHQTRDFVHVKDVVRANIAAAQSARVGKGDVVNIGSGAATSIMELARMIGGPVEHVEPRHEPRHCQADVARAEALFSWRARMPLSEGLAALRAG